jgi:hypothetical protein
MFSNVGKTFYSISPLEKHTVAQSICTHYCSLSGRQGNFLGSETLKKGPIYGLQKSECKKPGSLLFKKRRGWLLLLFLYNNYPILSTLLFATHMLDLFLQGHKPTQVLKTRVVGAD